MTIFIILLSINCTVQIFWSHILLLNVSFQDHDHNSSLAAPKDDGNIFSDAGLTVSVTSSLASPVDSGVALIDSDISEATTVNGEDTVSLREVFNFSLRFVTSVHNYNIQFCRHHI